MNFSSDAITMVNRAEARAKADFERIEETELITAERVLGALQQERIQSRHFAPTTGYGYDDIGRDALDRVFAHALQAESALVRPQLINGTHAIFTALAGLTEPGDVILSATGKPYDTLEEAIGIRGDAPQSLKRFGIRFEAVELTEAGKIRQEILREKITGLHPKIVYFQRSRGYAWRPSLHPEHDMAPVFEMVHAVSPDSIIMVDNCYGEFTTESEPLFYGADVMAGSLIKNPGGGLAPTGGYVAGREALIDRIAQRLTVPGIGREAGSYMGDYRLFFQGLFLAPHVVAQSLKGAALFGAMFELMGYDTLPASGAVRSDIIQSVRFRDPAKLIAFCRAVQAASPIESDVVPEPWEMPGYADPVIMAAGTFVQGATTELSADGPVTEPYAAYLQGALTYSHAKLAARLVYDSLAGGRGE